MSIMRPFEPTRREIERWRGRLRRAEEASAREGEASPDPSPSHSTSPSPGMNVDMESTRTLGGIDTGKSAPNGHSRPRLAMAGREAR